MADAILSVVKDNRRRRSFFEGTEGPWANDVKALQREVTNDKHDIANCAQGLLKLQEELRQMQDWAAKSEERSAKSVERAAKTGEQVEGQSLELQQLQEELRELRDKAKRWSHMQEGVKREEAKIEKVKTQPPILGTDAEHANVQLQKEEVLPKGEEKSQAEPTSNGHTAHPKFSLWNHLKKVIHEKLPSGQEYIWSESLWDAVVFVGTEEVNIAGSIVIIASFLLYLLVLTAFLQECGQTLTAPFLDQQAELEFNFWRTTVAHDPSVRNMVTGESLARTVCDQRMYTPFANLQFNIFADLSDYLTKRPLYGGPQVAAGMLMCTLSLTVWYLTLTIEIRAIAHQLDALLFMPRERCTRFEQDRDDPSKVYLVSMSNSKNTFVAALGLTRSVVVGFLAVYGTLFLVYEINLANMLLNCVALDVILNLDELFFSALLPKVAQHLFNRIQPIAIGYWHQGVHWNTYGSFIGTVFVIAAAFLTIWTYNLAPYRDRLQASSDALCGGVESSLDFVQVADRIGIPWAARTASSISTAETYAQQVVKSVKRDGFPHMELTVGHRDNSGIFMQVASADELDKYKSNLPEFKSAIAWEMANPTEYGSVIGWTAEIYVLAGRDFGDEPGTVYNSYLEFLLQRKGVTCNDVPEHRCFKHGSQLQDVVMRKLCPNRCGCPLVHEGSVSNAYSKAPQYGYAGCSIKDTRKKPFVDALAALPCMNSATSDSLWVWAQGVGDARSGTGAILKDELVVAFANGGCDAVASFDTGSGSFCQEGECDDIGSGRICQETSLMAICPESCGCNASIPWTTAHSRQLEYCPYSCGRGEPVCLTIKPPYHNESYATGPLVGFPCVFPFRYKAVTYHGCTDADWMGPWCAISTRKDGSFLHWGDCSDTC